MRLVLILSVFIALGIFPVNAQNYTFMATGTTSGVFSTVPSGTPFTFTLTFNAATTIATAGTNYTGPGVQNYIDPSGTATLTFGGVSESSTAVEFQVFSNWSGGIYGYEFGGSTADGDSLSIHLWSADSSVAPDTSLSSVHTSPISDFGLPGTQQNTHVIELNTPTGDIGGVVDDFTVTAAVPEPSAPSLLLLSLIAFVWMHRRSKSNSL